MSKQEVMWKKLGSTLIAMGQMNQGASKFGISSANKESGGASNEFGTSNKISPLDGLATTADRNLDLQKT